MLSLLNLQLLLYTFSGNPPCRSLCFSHPSFGALGFISNSFSDLSGHLTKAISAFHDTVYEIESSSLVGACRRREHRNLRNRVCLIILAAAMAARRLRVEQALGRGCPSRHPLDQWKYRNYVASACSRYQMCRWPKVEAIYTRACVLLPALISIDDISVDKNGNR